MPNSIAHCFTVFDNTWSDRFNYASVSEAVRYLIVGVELCPTTGKYHYQCYGEWGKKVSRKWIMETLSFKGYITERNGTREQARDYCKKEGKWIEYGSWEAGGQGARNDITHLREAIKTGMSETQLYSDYDVMWRVDRSARRFKLLWDSKLAKEKPKVEKLVLLYVGPPGTGKTTRAHAEFPNAFVLRNTLSGAWWDAYDGENEVIIDEFNGWIPYEILLVLLDMGSAEVPIKGGIKSFSGNTIILTSNRSPYEWYPNQMKKKEGIDALLRRLSDIIVMKDIMIGVGDRIGVMKDKLKGLDLGKKEGGVVGNNSDLKIAHSTLQDQLKNAIDILPLPEMD